MSKTTNNTEHVLQKVVIASFKTVMAYFVIDRNVPDDISVIKRRLDIYFLPRRMYSGMYADFFLGIESRSILKLNLDMQSVVNPLGDYCLRYQ